MKTISNFYNVAFDSTGRYIFATSEENILNIYDTEEEKTIRLRPGHEASCKNFAVHPKTKYVATFGCEGKV